MFNYSASEIQVPYIVAGQTERHELWFNEEMQDFKLKFFFPKEKTMAMTDHLPPWYDKLMWRYTIEYVNDNERVVTTGYFKLDRHHQTELNLEYYEQFQVKWIRFTIFYVENPQQRAWFSPIKGKHFDSKSSGILFRQSLQKILLRFFVIMKLLTTKSRRLYVQYLNLMTPDQV